MALARLTPSTKVYRGSFTQPVPRVVGAPHPLDRDEVWGGQRRSGLSHGSRRHLLVPAHLSTPWPTPGSPTAGPCPESCRLRRCCSASPVPTFAPLLEP